MAKEHFYNMDWVRYILAFGVIIAHYNIVMGTDYSWIISSAESVGVFFGLSGYLVFASYEKHQDFKKYVAGRARRIIPPYFFIVLSCAFGLSIISTISVSDYFCNIQWIKYLVSNLCFLNFVEPSLPGVFLDNDIQAVNASLWTLKVEWALYLSIPIICLLAKKMRVSILYIIIFVCICSTAFREFMIYKHEQTGAAIYEILGRQFMGQMLYFLSGTVFYILRDKIMSIGRIFFISTIAVLILIKLYDHYGIEIIGLDIVTFRVVYPIALTTLLLYVSTCKMQFNILPIRNFSYEIYLFHFPVIQIMYCYYGGNENKHLIFAATIAIIMICGYLFSTLYSRYTKSKKA